MMNERTEQRFTAVRESRTFSNILEAFDLRNKAVLDVGCSYGEFLIHFGKESTGVTVTEDEVVYAKSKGLDVRCDNVESDSFTLEKTYDVVFANNIFEHLYSPHHFLIKIREHMNDDGILILGVPCMPVILPLVHLPKFRGSLAVEHINFFTHYTLQKTVERGGFDILDVRGFHFKNRFIDGLLKPVYPHFYVIAKPRKDFTYPKRRIKELLGYKDIMSDLSHIGDIS
jgi:2-polyprenyl-3-methyl-5-hydroxy-6-metoxy-1,4-benzoquinol methylase